VSTAATSQITRIGIVGGGLMGTGIAEVCARAGLGVVVVDQSVESLERAATALDRSLARAAAAGKLSEDAAADARRRIALVDDLAAMADREVVIEAATEATDVKLAIFQALDRVVEDERAILATNTSSIPIMKLAMATSRPETVLGLHFFNPAPIRPLVELVSSLVTAPDMVERATHFAESGLHKQVVRSQDRAGFIVNALLIPYVLSAIRMFESGFASRDDIDQGMVLGCAHPLGPLALADLIGLDTVAAVAESLYAEFKEPLSSPPPLLARMVDAGLLGRKAGRGFYEYAGRSANS
jgi:3-hydroxybutyryl-CoA dehydrogenase